MVTLEDVDIHFLWGTIMVVVWNLGKDMSYEE
jgi:hypothetical protein